MIRIRATGFLCFAVVATAGLTPSPADGQQTRQEQAQQLRAASEQLIAEARELDVYDREPRVAAVFRRPHPQLRNLGPEVALDALEQLGRNFTGNEYRDTYIRWHLMWVVNQATQADRAQMTRRLTDQIRRLPGPLGVERRPERRYVPEEIWREHHRLVHSVRATIGYPPFQETVYGRNALRHLPRDERAAAERVLERADAMRDQFEVIRDEHAIAFNRRVDQMNSIMRAYRGELIYALISTGDPSVLNMVSSEVARQVRARTAIGFDLLAYVYMAGFDGIFQLYSEQDLRRFAGELESVARANEHYYDYNGQRRSFADYAFHLIYTLREGDAFDLAEHSEMIDATLADPETPDVDETYEELPPAPEE